MKHLQSFRKEGKEKRKRPTREVGKSTLPTEEEKRRGEGRNK
jgi:hypothetical protein